MLNDIALGVCPKGVQKSSLRKLHIPALEYGQSWQLFVQEQYANAIAVLKGTLNNPLSPDPDFGGTGSSTAQPAPSVQDGILLWARCLYQMNDAVGYHSLWDEAKQTQLIPAIFPEMEVINLGFDFKNGKYQSIIESTTSFIDEHCRELPPVLADYMYMRGLARSYLGNCAGARRDAETAFALFRVQGKEFEGGRAANLLGILHFRAAEFTDSIRWFRRALELHTGLGLRAKMGGNRLNIGIACYKRGEFQHALTEFALADELLSNEQADLSRCRLKIARGAVYRLLRDFESARSGLLEAYDDSCQLQSPREEALALEFIGDVLRDEGKIPQARRYYSRALAIGRSIAPDGDIVLEVMRRQGECLHLSGRQHEALPVLGRALTMARKQGDAFEEGVVQRILAEVMLSLGDIKTAAHYSEMGCARLKESGAKHELGLALMVAAQTHLAKIESGLEDGVEGLLDTAWQNSMSALDLFLKMDVEHWIILAQRLLTSISRSREEQDRLHKDIQVNPTRRNNKNNSKMGPIIHVSTRMRDLVQLTDAFADSDEPVLITGATGTGKELFARRLHYRSSRRTGNLVCVNVAAIPASMFEREFFGHVRGAFSGAERDSIGYAGQADGGTLFLDEIGELPLESQPKLLRLLQEGTFQAIGDPAERCTNIRLLAATNANLQQQVAAGTFRADLYYRLRILELRLPTMVERREDIQPLLQYFLGKAAERPVELSEFFNRCSLEKMLSYNWPGNVREIAMVARQAWVQMATRGSVSVDLGLEDHDSIRVTGPNQLDGESPVEHRPQSREQGRGQIILALAETEGNRAEAARRLGVSRSTLYRRMEKLGILGKEVSI